MIKNYIDPEIFAMVGLSIAWGSIIILLIKIYLLNRKDEKLYELKQRSKING